MSGIVERGSKEHYRDAALYDHEYKRRREDVRFYVALARRLLGGPGRILELGAGSGRVTLPLLRDGHEVVALDRSRTMLARLRARARPSAAGRGGASAQREPGAPPTRRRSDATTASRRANDGLTLVEGDLRTFRVPGRFPLVLAAFNVLEHLYTRVELAACLARVRAHLAPGGHFAFDVQVPDPGWLARDPRRRWSRTRFRDPKTGVAMIYSTNHDYDPVGQIALIRLYYERADGLGGTRVVHLSQRKYFPAELEALVASSGFDVVERYGDFHGGILDGNSASQVLVCARSRRK